MKKWLSVVFCAMLAVSVLPFNVFAELPTDIKNHWAETQITYCVDDGIITGYSDGTFKPDNTITRAEFITIINNAFGLNMVSGTEFSTFSDFDRTEWFTDQLDTAIHINLISGYSDNTIRPNDKITREEAASILYKLLGSEASPVDAQKFNDSDSITWSQDAVGSVVKYGIFSGYNDGTFKPQNPITRAEAVVAIGKAMILDPDNTDSGKEEISN